MKDGRKIARIVFLLYIAAVLYLCLGRFSDMSGMPVQVFGIDTDKLVHFLMFLPFPILFYMAFRRPTTKVWHSLVLTICILAIGCTVAAGTEIIQDFIPYRESDISDFMADFLAVCLSSAIVLVIDLNKTLRHA